jgi:hypothetical protein
MGEYHKEAVLKEEKKPRISRKVWVTLGVVAGVIAVVAIGGGVALWNYHEEPAFCSTFCHIMGPYVDSWTDSDLLANAHAEADVTCLDCHEPTLDEQIQEVIVYVQGDYSVPLPELRTSKDWCFRCHEHEAYAEVAELTKDYTIDGELHNPHDPHADVVSVTTEDFECRNCHSMHKESVGVEFCYECHHERTFTSCQGSDCHVENEGF